MISSTNYPEVVRFVSITIKSYVGKTKCDVKQIWLKISAVSLNTPGLSWTRLCFGFLVCKIGVPPIQGWWESEITNIKHIEQWVTSYKHEMNICLVIVVDTDTLVWESEYTSQIAIRQKMEEFKFDQCDLCWVTNGEKGSRHK